MRKIISIVFASFGFFVNLNAQTSVQAAIKPTSGVSSGVTIFLKIPTAITGKVSSVSIALAIPTSVGVRPIINANNAPNTSVVYTIQNTVDQMIQGVPHYVYNLLGTGDVTPAGLTYTLNADVENEILRAFFSGTNFSTSVVKVVNLPDGGTDPNPNSFLGFSVDGNDKVNESAMFYSVPAVSTAQNNIVPTGYSGLSLSTTSAAIALPVKFTSFSANKKDNDALLNWTVENETATTDHYEIERSLDGISFDKIITLARDNNANTSKIYNSIDANLSNIKKSGLIYYRIKQVDIDGRSVYSEIKYVRMGEKGGISLFPNPAKDFTNLSVDATAAGKVVIDIINADGKQLSSTTIQVQSGTNLKRIDTNNLPAGNYLVKIKTDNEEQIIKLIKL